MCHTAFLVPAPIFASSFRSCSQSSRIPVAPHRRSIPNRTPLAPRRTRPVPACVSSGPDPGDTLNLVETAVVATATVSFPLLAYSEITLLRTGCGLPPGPGGALGAAEGIAYLVLAGVLGWSALTKIKTGAGLRPGPFGVLGAVEGVAYLLAVLGIAAAGWTLFSYGDLPNAVPAPGSRCFPAEP